MYGRTGYHIAFAHVSPAFRWYGPELYFDGLELRSSDGRRVLARAGGGRIGADIWQLLQNGKLFALRVADRCADACGGAAGTEPFCDRLGGPGAGAERAVAPHVERPARRTLVIRHGKIMVLEWNRALPRLELPTSTST